MFYRVFAPKIFSKNLSFLSISCIDTKQAADMITDVTSKQHNEQRDAKMEYTITIIDNNEANVSRDGIGYCKAFYGPTFKADAIRYIKRVGGKNAKFKFEEYKYEIIGQ